VKHCGSSTESKIGDFKTYYFLQLIYLLFTFNRSKTGSLQLRAKHKIIDTGWVAKESSA